MVEDPLAAQWLEALVSTVGSMVGNSDFPCLWCSQK